MAKLTFWCFLMYNVLHGDYHIYIYICNSVGSAVSGDLSGYVATDQGFKYRSWSRLFVDIADKWQTNAADAVQL